MVSSAPGVLRFRNGVELRDPLALALQFLDHDYSYRSYDSLPIGVDDVILPEDVRAANRIGARMSSAEVDSILARKPRIEAALARIRPTSSLADDEADIPWEAIDDLYAGIAGLPRVGLAKATKFLHKKRPHLIPMLDSFVVRYLVSVDRFLTATNATALTRAYRIDLVANLPALRGVQDELRRRGYALTLCRILDLLTWAYGGDALPEWAEDLQRFIVRVEAQA
jgi:hypothetical protein